MATRDKPAVQGSVDEFARWIWPRFQSAKSCPRWPPEVFGICAAILYKSGAYAQVVQEWPPKGFGKTHKRWVKGVLQDAVKWRKGFTRGAPRSVQLLWDAVRSNAHVLLEQVTKNRMLCDALIQLCAVADETCAGVGIPSRNPDLLDRHAEQVLLNASNGSTLCKDIHWSKIRVLPKQHSPRSGITLRSISHHLSLCASADVVPRWITAPNPIEAHRLNILLLPWPKKVVPAQFRPASPAIGQLLNMDQTKFGFFCVDAELTAHSVDHCESILDLLKEARSVVGPIDGVVLPELSVVPSQHQALRDKLIPENCFLICGVAAAPQVVGEAGDNYVVIDIPVSNPEGGKPTYIEIKQSKHHRWRLDRSQIVQYGLGSQLDPTREWWEHISLSNREINFITLKDWLTICVLICEDLARPDPVGDLVRCVGPNLVVALLMDGPQLTSRWPGRYATVLTDDPGSSVLTLSSAGMVDLCRPPAGAQPVRTVALWKDARNREGVHINLPQDADGMVISLTRDKSEEFTADGRSDHGETAYPVLSGVQPIFCRTGVSKCHENQ